MLSQNSHSILNEAHETKNDKPDVTTANISCSENTERINCEQILINLDMGFTSRSSHVREAIERLCVAFSNSAGVPLATYTCSVVESASNLCAQRFFLWNFNEVAAFKYIQQADIRGLTIFEQEPLIVNDLVHILCAMQGDYIMPIENVNLFEESIVNYQREYNLKNINCGYHNFINDITPLANNYNCIMKFIFDTETTNAGKTLQALGAILKIFMHDYVLVLYQLRNLWSKEKLHITRLRMHLMTTTVYFQMITAKLLKIHILKLRGAALLSELYRNIIYANANEKMMEMFQELLEAAAVPFIQHLNSWLQKGILTDTSNEFMIIKSGNEIDTYLDQHFVLRRDHVPCFLEQYANIILNTGKYLNIIKQCSKNAFFHNPKIRKIVYKYEDKCYINLINEAHTFASKTFLHILLNEHHFMDYMRSIKRYLLVYQGDFIMQFMDACEQELSKYVHEISLVKLQVLLGLTLNTTLARNDRFKDNLHFELRDKDLVETVTHIHKVHDGVSCTEQNHHLLNGWDCFNFVYDVPNPIAFVVHELALNKYQLIFRQMFYIRNVINQLLKLWKDSQVVIAFRTDYRVIFGLHHKMLLAAQDIYNFMTTETIQSNWLTFEMNMHEVNCVDSVICYHDQFLDNTLTDNLLTNDPEMIRTLFEFCNFCLTFCDIMQKNILVKTKTMETTTETFQKYNVQFDQIMGKLTLLIIKYHTPSDHLHHLLRQINFNNYYDNSIKAERETILKTIKAED